MSIKVKARITKELFHKDDYYILSAVPIGDCKGVVINSYGNFTLVGSLGFLTVNETYEMILSEGKATKYGLNYTVESVPSLEKKNLEDLSYDEKFKIMKTATGSDRLATNVLEAYPDFIYNVVMYSDEELEDIIDIKNIYGVGKVYYKAMKRNLREKFTYFSFINREELKKYNLSIDDSKSILREWCKAEEASENVENDPYYALIEVCGHSFVKTDSLLKSVRKDLVDSDQRCCAVVMDILHKNESEGNTRLNGNILYVVMRDDYNCPELFGRLVNVCKNSEHLYYDEVTKDVSIFETYMKEVNIASFAKTANKECDELDFNVEDYRVLDNGLELTDEQLMAVENFRKYRFSIVDSKAGSGKSSSAKSIVEVCKKLNMTLTILAPTGVASMRIAETTNHPASTIHLKCLRDGEINTDVLLVDEGSMIDLDVFNMMVSCIKNENIRIIIMGDRSQINPVGIGTPYADLATSGVIPVSSFTKVFRYGNSGIAYANTNTREGRNFFDDDVVEHDGNKLKIMDDWEFIQKSSDKEITDEIVNQYRKLIKSGVNKEDIMVLTAYNVGQCGTYAINNTIQDEFNPAQKDEKIMIRKNGSSNIVFRNNDIVINKKNDYSALPYDSWVEIENSNGLLTSDDVATTVVYNGQKGLVTKVTDKVAVIKFDEQLVVFDKLQVYNLLLGRVQSLHSSQGQEAKYVICAVTPSQSRLLNKNLLYVANSRARVKHINIGSVEAYKNALKIDGVLKRNTWLLDLLK